MDIIELLSKFSLFLKQKKEEGKKIIAFISHDNIPEELIDAAGFIPMRMMFAGNDELMNASHDFLPPSTCAFVQSSIGLFSLKPSNYDFLDLIDYFIVSNHCVSDICASEIISKYFNIPRLSFYNSYIQNNNSVKYFKLELLNFKKQLEKITGKKIVNKDLMESIIKYNNFKKKLLDLKDLNIIGSQRLKIFQKGMLIGPEFLPELINLIQKYKELSVVDTNKLKDLILTGGSIFINDYLIDLVEESGGNIVFFDTWIGNHYASSIFLEESLNSNQDPFDLLSLRYKNNIYGDHSVPDYLENKISQIEKIFRDYKEKTDKKLGVINHIIKFCDHISIMSNHFKNQLKKRGIPVLNLERDYSRANKGQLSTRIEAFLEML
jgi:benzoyl-CoA reductase/2-hydroxyglutaryl-CoA dehydratase subunit BcrC/BadD/HgdB